MRTTGSAGRWLMLLLAWCLAACAHRAAESPPIAEPASTRAFDPGGLGVLAGRTEHGDTGHIELRRVLVVAHQREDMAEVSVEHVFYNDSDLPLEGTFRFPMPDGALLTGLAMMIDGKLVEGELVEREKARKIYQEIVDSMQDPALLEWEHGSTFKMRVFPIEPRREKVVTMRYLTPLRRRGDTFAFVQGARTASGTEPVPALAVEWEGVRVFAEKDVAATRVVEVPAQAPALVLREKRAEGVYTAVRIRPNWDHIPVEKKPVLLNWFIVVDTSRSSLEDRALELETLRAVLGALPLGSRFQIITSDLEARAAEGGLVASSPSSVTRAIEFVSSTTADGASDLGRALGTVGALARTVPDSAAVYIGDCEPTWGVTEPGPLRDLAARELPHTPLYLALLGASVDESLAAELAEITHGRAGRARRREDLESFVETLAHGTKALSSIEISAPEASQVLPAGALSLEPGRELVVYLMSSEGHEPLTSLRVQAKANGQTINLLSGDLVPQETRGVAQRFGSALVHQLEKDSGTEAEVVKTSLSYGVMSKYTSFLVLENEEAYARYSIDRKASADRSDPPRITGQNLESIDGVDISANRIQPGDPEIFIDAERDARSVRVEFPFGETKEASYDPEARGGRGAWMVRFLVDRSTAEGDYRAVAYIQHRDGRREKREVSYTVDRTAPEFDVQVKPAAHQVGMMEVSVVQRGLRADADLRRVEMQTPAGRIQQLVAIRWGAFRAFIPRSELASRHPLRVVGFDEALNHTVREIALP